MNITSFFPPFGTKVAVARFSNEAANKEIQHHGSAQQRGIGTCFHPHPHRENAKWTQNLSRNLRHTATSASHMRGTGHTKHQKIPSTVCWKMPKEVAEEKLIFLKVISSWSKSCIKNCTHRARHASNTRGHIQTASNANTRGTSPGNRTPHQTINEPAPWSPTLRFQNDPAARHALLVGKLTLAGRRCGSSPPWGQTLWKTRRHRLPSTEAGEKKVQ